MRLCSVGAAALAMLLSVRAAQAQTCVPPRVLVVLDKSSSMVRGTVATGETKWAAARAAINDVVHAYQDSIDFGLMLYPDPNQCGGGKVKVDIGPNTAATISSWLQSDPPWSGNYTPTSQSLDAAGTYAPLLSGAENRYVLLITDGYQMCYAADGSEDWSMRTAAIASATALQAKGIRTFVVGFGSDVDVLTLNRTAAAGGTAPAGCNPNGTALNAADRCYLQANTQSELVLALDGIAFRATEEVCDNKDNDCDGYVDNVGGGVSSQLSKACSTICGSGVSLCSAGTWGACSARLPVAEGCNGVDDDCDGRTDNAAGGTAAITRACATACGSGLETCAGAGWGSCSARAPVAETCNGLDDDCDGRTDNVAGGTAPLAAACSTACGSGVRTCSGGSFGACSARAPAAEACNGVDDDCDGATDNTAGGAMPIQRACSTICGGGFETCGGGAWGNCSARVPVAESCNGVDDDCDGRTDNVAGSAAALARACSSACGAGLSSCVAGGWGACDARLPTAETCNNVDDDCDGRTDNVGGSPAPLSRGCSTRCGSGNELCNHGQWDKCGAPQPRPETCNGKDDDCDGMTDNDGGEDRPLVRACTSDCEVGRSVCGSGAWGACSARPRGIELCNGIDDDCDGLVDNRGDGSPAPLERPCATACASGFDRCAGGRWGGCSARTGQPESCNALDDDCNGVTDDGCECMPGQRRACSRNVGECSFGTQTCGEDGRWSGCEGGRLPAGEICDGLDNDCSGARDDGAECDEGALCACGRCAAPCVDGACGAGAACVSGFCVSDACPAGTYCVELACVPGSRPPPPSTPASSGGTTHWTPPAAESGAQTATPDGCGCGAGLGSAPALLALARLLRRRRR